MSLDHQDWNPVVFKKKQSTTLTSEDIRRSNYKTKQREVNNSSGNNNTAQKLYKIDNETESFEIKKVSLSLSKQIQQARLSNKMTQKELALKINVSNKIINDYESGKAIPDNNVKMKIQRALNINFKK
tara:strand:- start:176 stop:559 length:384 start_codon:yes stop_codon:yes gene_type:complete